MKIDFIECRDCESLFNDLNELSIVYCRSGSQYLKKYCCPNCDGDLDFFAGYVDKIEDDKFNFRLAIYSLHLIEKDLSNDFHAFRLGLTFPDNKGVFIVGEERKLDFETYEDAEELLKNQLERFSNLSKDELEKKITPIYSSRLEMPSNHEIYSVDFELKEKE